MVRSSPIVEILGGLEPCARAVVSIVATPQRTPWHSHHKLQDDSIHPLDSQRSAEGREGLQKWPVYFGDNSKLFLKSTERMRPLRRRRRKVRRMANSFTLAALQEGLLRRA